MPSFLLGVRLLWVFLDVGTAYSYPITSEQVSGTTWYNTWMAKEHPLQRPQTWSGDSDWQFIFRVFFNSFTFL